MREMLSTVLELQDTAYECKRCGDIASRVHAVEKRMELLMKMPAVDGNLSRLACSTSYGLHSYGLYGYGLYSYGLCSYGLCSHGQYN